MEAQFISDLNSNRRIIYHVLHKYCNDEYYMEDLFHDVVCRAWPAYKRFRNESSFRQWICRIARNTAIDRLRRIKGNTLLTNNILFEIIDTPYEEASISPSVINSLSSIEKRTFELYLEGLSYKQIGEITNEPANRIAVRMHRMKQHLQKAIKNNQ